MKNKNKKTVFDTPEFREQLKTWDHCLEKEGFAKIDQDNTVVEPEVFTVKQHRKQFVSGPEVYELCQQILKSYKFNQEFKRVIIELHGSGKSVREIVQHMKGKSYTPAQFNQMKVHRVIKSIKEDFLRNY